MPKVVCIVCRVVAAALCFPIASAAVAQVPNYDFQWATITDVNNPAYGGGPFGELAGRGSVAYEYRISRLELTSAQFMEFVNTFWESEQIPLPHWFIGSSGISFDLQGPYALRDDIPNAGMVPVIGLNWRTAAMYCNWLHNGKSSDLASTQSGAYDVSTFGTNPDGTFTDQMTRSPGAKFWIPSLDEWLKAAHYDPNRYGKGQGGWWQYPNASDVPLTDGPPGIGQTNGAGTFDWQSPPTYVPLGAYDNVQSSWGLWDVAGGAGEWTEEVIDWGDGPRFRVIDGSWAGAWRELTYLDTPYGIYWDQPGDMGQYGLRVASAVPCPSSIACVTLIVVLRSRRERTGKEKHDAFSSHSCIRDCIGRDSVRRCNRTM
jgi:hypothetical protein